MYVIKLWIFYFQNMIFYEIKTTVKIDNIVKHENLRTCNKKCVQYLIHPPPRTACVIIDYIASICEGTQSHKDKHQRHFIPSAYMIH
jgi:hypothetical protein